MTIFWKKAQMASNQKVFRDWVIATVFGLWLTVIVTGSVYFLLSGWLKPTTAVMPIQALLSGLTVGACQWIVLNKHSFKKAYWWIVATTLGNFFAYVLLIPLFSAALALLTDPSIWDIALLNKGAISHNIAESLAIGLGIGVAQWQYLRTRLPNTAAWIAVVMWATVLSQVVWLVPMPQFQSAEAGVQGFLEIFQPSLEVQVMMTAFHFARLSLLGVIQAGITGIWLTEFVARQRRRA